MSWFLLGLLGLAALDAALSSPAAAGRAGTLLSVPTRVLQRLADPRLPLVPNYHDTKPSAGQDGIGGK